MVKIDITMLFIDILNYSYEYNGGCLFHFTVAVECVGQDTATLRDV